MPAPRSCANGASATGTGATYLNGCSMSGESRWIQPPARIRETIREIRANSRACPIVSYPLRDKFCLKAASPKPSASFLWVDRSLRNQQQAENEGPHRDPDCQPTPFLHRLAPARINQYAPCHTRQMARGPLLYMGLGWGPLHSRWVVLSPPSSLHPSDCLSGIRLRLALGAVRDEGAS